MATTTSTSALNNALATIVNAGLAAASGVSGASGSSGSSGASGFCSAEKQISNLPCDSLRPALAVDPSGNIGICWQSATSGNSEIYFELLDSNIPPASLSQVVTGAGCSAFSAWLAGRCAASGSGTSGFSGAIGAALTCESQLTCSPYPALYPSIISDSNARFHIVYESNPTGHEELYYIQLYPQSVGPKQCTSNFPIGSFGFGNSLSGGGTVITPSGSSGASYPPTGPSGSFFAYGNRLLPDPVPLKSGPILSQTGIHMLFRDFYDPAIPAGQWTGVSLASDFAAWSQQAAAQGISTTPPYVAGADNPVVAQGAFGTSFSATAFTNIAFLAETPPDMSVEVQTIRLPLKPKCTPNSPPAPSQVRTQDLASAPIQPAPPLFQDPVDISYILNSPLTTLDETVPQRFTIAGQPGTVFTNILTDNGLGQLSRITFDCDTTGACNAETGYRFILGQRQCGQELCAAVPSSSGTSGASGGQYSITLQVWIGQDYRSNPSIISNATMPATMVYSKDFAFGPGDDVTTFSFAPGELFLPDGQCVFFVPIAGNGVEFFIQGAGNGHAVWYDGSTPGTFSQYYVNWTETPNSGLQAPVYYDGVLAPPTSGAGFSGSSGYSAAMGDAVAIAAGKFHSLALRSDGTVWAWGANESGQLGNGSNAPSASPVQVSNLTGIIAVAAGCAAQHNLALMNDGTVWTWGNNDYGQLGNGTTASSNVPVQVLGLSGITAIAAEWTHSLALRSDGTVWAWGANGNGQLGNGATTGSNIPVQVTSLTGVVAIAAGIGYSDLGGNLAAKNDGTVWTWGFNYGGVVGTSAVQVPGLSNVMAVAEEQFGSLTLKNDGTAWAWGYNADGELGIGSQADSFSPMQVSNLTGIAGVAGGTLHGLALDGGGNVWTWGANGSGQLGNGTTVNSSIPLQVPNFLGIAAIAGGGDHSLALRNGLVWAWGNNDNGQLGNGSRAGSLVPIQSLPLPGVPSASGTSGMSGSSGSSGSSGASGSSGIVGTGPLLMTAPIQLTSSPGDSVHPRLAIDGNDNIWLAFFSNRTGTDEVYAAKYFGNCGQWGTSNFGGVDFRLTNAGANGKAAQFPSVACDSAGEAHFAWQSTDTEDGLPDIFYARTTGGGTQFLAPIRLTDSPGSAMMPDIVVAAGPGTLGAGINALGASGASGACDIDPRTATGGAPGSLTPPNTTIPCTTTREMSREMVPSKAVDRDMARDVSRDPNTVILAALTESPNPASVGQSVTFTEPSITGSITLPPSTYLYANWDFGDGSMSAPQVVVGNITPDPETITLAYSATTSHAYSTGGAYTVILRLYTLSPSATVATASETEYVLPCNTISLAIKNVVCDGFGDPVSCSAGWAYQNGNFNPGDMGKVLLNGNTLGNIFFTPQGLFQSCPVTNLLPCPAVNTVQVIVTYGSGKCAGMTVESESVPIPCPCGCPSSSSSSSSSSSGSSSSSSSSGSSSSSSSSGSSSSSSSGSSSSSSSSSGGSSSSSSGSSSSSSGGPCSGSITWAPSYPYAYCDSIDFAPQTLPAAALLWAYNNMNFLGADTKATLTMSYLASTNPITVASIVLDMWNPHIQPGHVTPSQGRIPLTTDGTSSGSVLAPGTLVTFTVHTTYDDQLCNATLVGTVTVPNCSSSSSSSSSSGSSSSSSSSSATPSSSSSSSSATPSSSSSSSSSSATPSSSSSCTGSVSITSVTSSGSNWVVDVSYSNIATANSWCWYANYAGFGQIYCSGNPTTTCPCGTNGTPPASFTVPKQYLGSYTANQVSISVTYNGACTASATSAV